MNRGSTKHQSKNFTDLTNILVFSDESGMIIFEIRALPKNFCFPGLDQKLNMTGISWYLISILFGLVFVLPFLLAYLVYKIKGPES